MKKLPAENVRAGGGYKKLRSRFVFVIFLFLIVFMLISGIVFTFLYSGGGLKIFAKNSVLAIASFYLVSFAAASVLALYVDRNILRPIENLSDASKKVAEGDFSVKLPVEKSSEEMFTTCLNFNAMVEALSASETLKNDFIANVSHEFKTPISAIEGYAALLQDENLSEDERRVYTEKILFNTRRLSDLTSNILLLSKLENQKVLPDGKNFRLDEQLREAILILEPKWSAKNINFHLDDIPEITFFGNEPLLLQVWTNIIGNAVKFVNEDGHITVSAEETLNFVTVKIADDGIGMSEETKYRIFDKFWQGDTSRRSQGNGLGLTLCMAIVSRCGGTISVDSELRKGSVFTVKLPKTDFPAE